MAVTIFAFSDHVGHVPLTGNGQMRIMDAYVMDFPISVFTPELPLVNCASVFITLEILTAENGGLCSVLMHFSLTDVSRPYSKTFL